MNSTEKTRSLAKASTRRLLRRASSAVAVLAVTATAIGMPVIAPETTDGASSVVAIARADCPPDCGPGGGGTPSGPPGGGTEFVPPSMPAMPSYEPGRGQPPMDQNNGISIYNSATPQPSQAAQPSQPPVQNQDGSYNRAANGEQQPINYNQAPQNQGINQDWQNLSNQLNQQQPAQNNGQQDQSQNTQQDKKQTCESITQSVLQQFPVDLFELTDEEISHTLDKSRDEERKNGGKPVAAGPVMMSDEHQAQVLRYNEALADAMKQAGLQCSADGPTPASSEIEKIRPQTPAPAPNPDEDEYGQYKCDLPFHTSDQWTNSADLAKYVLENFNTFFPFSTPGPFPLHEGQDTVLQGGPVGDEPIRIVSITDNSFTFLSGPWHSEGSNRYITFTLKPGGSMPWTSHSNDFGGTDWTQAELWDLTVQAWGPLGNMSLLGDVNGAGACSFIWTELQHNLDTKVPQINPNSPRSGSSFHGHS